MAWWFIPLVVVALLGTAVIVITVVIYILRRRNIERVANENKDSSDLNAKIGKIYRDGNYNIAEVGLYDKKGNQTKNIVIKADEIEEDFYVGDTFRLTS